MPQRPPTSRPRTMAEALQAAELALRTQRADEAERLATYVLKSQRGNAQAARILGQALLIQSRSDEAVDPLRRAARGGKDPEVLTLLARALATTGREDEALDHLAQATAQRPPFPLAFLELGDLLGRLGRIEEGVAVFEAGLALTPDAAVLRIGLGYLHLRRNRRAQARELFAQVHAAAPQRHDAVIGLARVLALEAEHAAAAELYRRALALRPNDATRISLAKCLLELGDRDAGEAMLRTATRSGTQLAWEAIMALTATPHGRAFLRPSAAARFLSGAAN